MKITKRQLRQIIREEVSRVVAEQKSDQKPPHIKHVNKATDKRKSYVELVDGTQISGKDIIAMSHGVPMGHTPPNEFPSGAEVVIKVDKDNEVRYYEYSKKHPNGNDITDEYDSM